MKKLGFAVAMMAVAAMLTAPTFTYKLSWQQRWDEMKGSKCAKHRRQARGW